MITMRDLVAIADAVQEAVDSIPSSEERGKKVCMGADGSCSSEVDKVAENAALMYIEREHLPLNVLSEEIGYVDNGGEEVLVMDPVDGTSNAIAGLPLYTVSLAVGASRLSDVRMAYVRNLATGEAMWAERGRGAFKNGEPIHVRRAELDDIFLMIYEGNGAHPDAFTVAKAVRSSRSLGCTSLEMCIVAEGQADGYFMKAEKYTRSVRVVDIAASSLILREAGGEVYDLDNNILDMPFDLEHRSNFLAVGDRRIYDIIVRHRVSHVHRYGVYANAHIGNILAAARRVIDVLREEGADFCVDTEIADALGVPGIPLSRMGADIVIVVGGDGTILRALQATDAIIVGVNGGSVGFLAEIETDGIEEGIRRLLAEDYIVESRFKISTFYNGEYLKDSVNEAVVHTDTIAKIRHFRVYVDDVLASELRSDGIIVSTPTGSTCYAMSLGAPYMDPKVEAMMVVPMAAYKFNSRPFVVPATSKVTVENVLDKGCIIVLDGQEEIYMEGGSKVEFMMSEKRARFVRFDTDFYSRVKDKLVNSL